jgi:hypothetical protein
MNIVGISLVPSDKEERSWNEMDDIKNKIFTKPLVSFIYT